MPKSIEEQSSQAETSFLKDDYKYGFSTKVDREVFAKGLNEDVIRRLSQIKKEPEFLLNFRLKAFSHWKKF